MKHKKHRTVREKAREREWFNPSGQNRLAQQRYNTISESSEREVSVANGNYNILRQKMGYVKNMIIKYNSLSRTIYFTIMSPVLIL